MGSLKQTKRYLFLMLIALFIFSCNEDEEIDLNKSIIQSENFVGIENAKEIGSVFDFSVNNNTAKSSFEKHKNKKIASINEITDNSDESICYVINYENGGFVIISADKRVYPILAYSESNTFTFDSDNYPQGLVNWIDNTVCKVKKIRELNSPQKPEIKDIWDNLYYIAAPPYEDYYDDDDGYNSEDETDYDDCNNTYTYVGPFLSTVWDQYTPYNDAIPSRNCSEDSEGRPLVGCVALAMGQVMKYHEFPNTYNWDLMPDNDGSTETARLLWDAGKSIFTVYGCLGSGAEITRVTTALKDNFGYSSAVLSDFNSNTVISELNYGLPVILGATVREDGRGGHVWVCDGYLRAFFCASGAGYLSLHMVWGMPNANFNAYYYYNGDWTMGEYSLNENKVMITRIIK
ncbi:MAG: hypothetical protein GQ564_21210 [Bacteroidales bacterium]|nr:hypothetical protein [Bacteroidales bacterium]